MWNGSRIKGVGTPPCYGCAERQAECHGTCELYKDWRKKLEEYNAVKITQMRADPGISMARIMACRKRAVNKARGRK